MGFRNEVVGGIDLVRSAIQSPNFVQSPLTGWSIDQDGNAYFQTVTIGGGVVKVTFASTAPSGPNTGDVWFDLANGTVSHWDGAAWANFQYGTNAIQNAAIGTAQIANNAVTNALLAAAAVAASNIQNGAITTTQINAAAGILGGQLAANAGIVGGQIASGTLTNSNLAGSVTARSLGGITTTVSGTAPVSPVTGDIWIDSGNGYQLQQWNGTAWTAITFTGSDVLASGSVTGTQIASSTITGTNLASSVTARSLGGVMTTISATAPASPIAGDLWIDSASGYQLQQYSGTAWTPITWTATDVISAATITGSLIAASTVTGGNVAAGTLTASNIHAGTITANNLAVGTILNQNPYMAGSDITGYAGNNATLAAVTGATGAPYTYAVQGTASTAAAFYADSPSFPVQGNQPYNVQAYIYSADTTGAIGFRWYDSTGTHISDSISTAPITASTWTQLADTETSPTNAVTAKATIGIGGSPLIGDTFEATGILVTSNFDGGIIQAGTIQGGSIAAATIEGGNIDAATIVGANIAAGTIEGSNIDASTITGGNVAAGTLTAANIASGTITADLIAANAIVAGLIAAGAVDGMTINSATLNSGTVNATDVLIQGTEGGLFVYGSGGGQVVKTFTSSGNWTAPSGVTSATVEAWGGGGGGSTNTSGGGGGGGGEYAKGTVTVTPGNVYAYVVGAAGGTNTAGGNSTFNSTSVVAKGGSAGSGTSGGAGGTGGTGTTLYNGGAGAAGSGSGTTSVILTSSGTWTAPAGVTSVEVEAVGGGAGGAGGGLAGGANSGGYGGGGGGYARLNSYTVVPGNNYSYTIGGGGSGGAVNSFGSNGGNTSWVSTATCLASGGLAANASHRGEPGSGNTGDQTYAGGFGGYAYGSGGSGGGSSAGNSSNGNTGGTTSSSSGGSGGTAPVDGGAGGNGGSANNNGSAGSVPGGGGGGGGGGSSAGTGGAGARGRIKLTYSSAQAGGGGGSGGTGSAGNAGSLEAGASSVSGGGPGGGALSGGTWTASPSSGPGGGGGGYDANGNAGAGAAGQIRITYSAGSSTLIGSVAGASGTDPVAGTSYPEGANFDNLQVGTQITAPDASTWTSTGISLASGKYITSGSWQAATLTNGWTGTLNYRITAQGDLHISADLVAGTTTNGTTIYTFPAAYRPAAKRRIPAAFDGSVAAGGNPYFILNIDGTFTVHWVTSTQTNGGFEATVRLA